MSKISKLFVTWSWKFPGLAVLYSAGCYLIFILLLAVFSDSAGEVSDGLTLGLSALVGGLISYYKFRGEFIQVKSSLRPGENIIDAWKKEISPFIASAQKASHNTKSALGTFRVLLSYCLRLVSLIANVGMTLYKKSISFFGRKKAAERAEANLEAIKAELNLLDTEIKASEKDFLNICKENYRRIVSRVEQEQNDLSDLSDRHTIIGKFLVTRGIDDLNSDVYRDLKRRLSF